MLDLATIGIAMDTSGLEKGARALDAAEKSANKAATAADKVGKASTGAASSYESVRAAVDKLTSQEALHIQKLVDEYKQLGMSRSQMEAYRAAQAGMSKGAQEIAAAVGAKIDAYKREQAELSRLTSRTEESTASMMAMARTGVAAFLGGAIVQGAMAASKAMFEASSNAERLRTMLDFSTGGNSAREIEYLRSVTGRLGLEFNSTAKAYGQFQAAAKGTSLEGDKARAVFESVAKASAVMGLSAGDTSGVLLALQQMISKGTVQAEELRGQLGERLPGAFQIAAKSMGVTTAELGKMLEQGQVVADDFLPKFAVALEKNLGGAAEKAADRLDAAVNRFDTAWERLKQTAGDSGISKAIAEGLGSGAGSMNAISIAMERARVNGDGFFGQMFAGAVTVQKLMNVMQRATVNMYDNAEATKKAEAELARLQARGDDKTKNIYIQSSYFQLQEYIKELKAAQAEQAKLTGGPGPNPNMNAGVTASGRAREQYNIRRAADDEALNSFRLKQAGVPPSYIKDMAELIRLNQAGALVGNEYTAALKKQQDVLLKKAGAVKSSNAAANQEQNTYESLIASIRGKIEADNLELSGGAALTESQRIRIKLDQDLAAGRIKLGSAHQVAIRAAIEDLSVSEAEVAAKKAIEKANLSAAAAREKYIASLDTGLEKIQADIAAQNEATARMGLSKEAIAALDAAKLEMLSTDTELQAIKALDRNLDEQTYQALKKQAAAYRDLAKAKQGGAAKETALDIAKADADAAKKAADEWQKTADSINSSLTDALMRGFESGKGFAMNLRDTVVNMFKTMVLRPIISAVLSPISGALMGGMGLSGAANAGTSALGTVGNLASGASLLGGLGTFGGGLSAGFGGLMGTLGIGATTGATLGGAMSAGGIALGAGNIMGGLGTIAGALGPIALGVALIASLIKPRTYHSGGAGSYSAEGGASTGLDVLGQGLTFGVGASHYDKAAEAASVQVAKSISGLLDSTAKVFGKDAGYYAATAFADDSSKDGAWGSLIIKRLDDTIVNWADTQTSKWAPKVFADGDAGKAEYMQQLAASTKQAILSIGLPEWAQRIAQSMPDSGSMEDLSAMLAQIQAYPAQLLQAYGTSRDDLVNQFIQGLQSGDAATAGQSVADTLVGSIQNAVYGQAAGQIFDIVNMGIVTPMLDAIATGASVSEALSQATIDATIKRAKEQAAVLAELFGNAEFTAAMEQIRTAVGSALGQAGTSIQRLPFVAQQIDTAAQDAAQAATEAASKWQQITDGLLGTRLSLAIELLRAQGQQEAALAMERAEAIKGMDAYQVGLYDANTGTRALIDSLTRMKEISEQLASELPGVVSKFLTPEQNTANSYGAIAGDLIKAGLSGMGVGALTQALTGASKAEIAQAATAIYNMAGVTDEMRLALVRAAGGLADLKTEAEGLQRSETDNAMAALEKAANARRSLLQESIDDIRAVFETVRDNARALYGEVESTARGMADAGRAFIDNALSAAKLTGYLPDGKALSEAIGDVRKGIGETQYKTQIDADRDRLVLAGKLSQLQAISGDQLTEAEKQLKALDDLLASSHSQIDALRGIDASVMSVEAAVAALAGAMGREKAGGGGGGGGGGGNTGSAASGILNGPGGSQYNAATDTFYAGTTGLPYFGAALGAAAIDLVNAGKARDLYDIATANGVTSAMLGQWTGTDPGVLNAWAQANNLPSFANGGVHTGGWAMVGERGPELAYMPPARIYSAGQTSGMTAGGNTERLEGLVVALTTEVQRLQGVVAQGNQNTKQFAEQFDNVTGGGNAIRSETVGA